MIGLTAKKLIEILQKVDPDTSIVINNGITQELVIHVELTQHISMYYGVKYPQDERVVAISHLKNGRFENNDENTTKRNVK